MNIKKLFPWFISFWLFLFSFVPTTLLLILSFLTPDLKLIAKFPWTLTHYSNLLNPMFFRIAWRSLYLAGLSTGLCLIIAYPFCYFLLKIKNKSLILILVIIPFWTSSLIRTFAMVDLLKWHGFLNHALISLKLIQHPLTMLYNNFAVFLGLVYNLLPFMILPILNSMEVVDFICIEAARDLGASPWQIFTKVFWPQTVPGVMNGVIMVFLPAMTLFYIPNILGGAKSILLGNLIQNQFLFLNNWPQGAATSCILTFILMLVFWFTQTKGGKKS